MSLIVVLQRVKTVPNNEPGCEYNVRVQVNEHTIAIGYVAGHRRSDGWRALLKKFLDEGGGKDLDR